jgi:hypothetical protein
MAMKRIWGFVLGGVISTCIGGVLLPACAHDDSTIFVQSVLAPQLVAPGTGCAYTNDPTQPTIDEGLLDIDLRDSYSAAFLLANQLVPRGDPSAPQTETSFVNIKGAVVRITDAASGALVSPPFTSLASIVISPAQGSTPGYGAITDITLLDQTTVANLGALINGERRLLVFTKFFGTTLGGQYVESNDFQFPIDVCSGCLISFSAADISSKCQNVNCFGNSTTMMGSTVTVPCNFEDFAVDCSACKGPIGTPCNPACIPFPTVPTATPDAGGD